MQNTGKTGVDITEHKLNGADESIANDERRPESKGLYAMLSEYNGSDYYPCHMPGHKRNPQAGDMAGYYGIDITEIDGFDNLHHAEGILREAQRRANRLYGAEETFYLVGGSTCGILSSVMTAVERGGELLMSRNCHKSVYHAAILQELDVHYYYPSMLAGYGIYDGVTAQEIGRLLDAYPACGAVVITSPTYEGILSDVEAVAYEVHRRDKILIVDEAHGAHLGLDDHMPRGAVAAGADLVIHSLHKTLPSMTQTALLHVQGQRVDRGRLRRYLSMLQTSSPSYVMMASMDSCIRYMEIHGAERFAFMRKQYDLFCNRIKSCKHIYIGKMTDVSCEKEQLNPYSMFGWDIGKLVIFVRDTFWSGQHLYEILREDYHLQMEMAAESYVLAIMTVMDTQAGWQRLADALVEIDGRIEEEIAQGSAEMRGLSSWRVQQEGYAKIKTVTAMIPARAFDKPREKVALSGAVGRIAADFVNLYPPGIPLLVPGEVISAELLVQIQVSMDIGLQVQGIAPDGNIAVVV